MSLPAPANLPPFALDGTVTRAKLNELLGVQTELAWLDYKSACDLGTAEGLVELVKDVGAMMIQGGYLVIGADGIGAPIGLPGQQERLFDEAALSDNLAKYLPSGFEVRSAVHDLSAELSGSADLLFVALVWVAPHPDGWVVFTRNGDYTVDGKPKVAFRKGDVFARHGSRSEPWAQSDIDHARIRLVASEKDRWRAEIRTELQGAQQSAAAQSAAVMGPSAAFTWQLDAAGFEAAVVELLRRDDDVPIRRMLRTAQADSQRLAFAGNLIDLQTLLDRITTVAALAIELHRPSYLELTVDALLALYDRVFGDQYALSSSSNPEHLPEQVICLQIAERLYALGALAVRVADWPAVRLLALAPVPERQRQSLGRTWHRHALTQASRAGLMQDTEPGGRTRRLSLLLFARSVAAANPALLPDLAGAANPEAGGRDPVLTSLGQFDLLATIISGVAASATTQRELLAVSYPNYALLDSRDIEDVVLPLITASKQRAELLGDAGDDQVAAVLQQADRIAQEESRGFFGWEGYRNDDMAAFIQRHRRQAG